MKKLTQSLQKNMQIIKDMLPSSDILHHSFFDLLGKEYIVIFADGLVQKEWLTQFVILPIESSEKLILPFPESKEEENFDELIKGILDGNPVLLHGGNAWVIGVKAPPSRAIIEPQANITIKGPREGFVEDVKTNMALVRKRIKTPNLQFEMLSCGEQSDSHISLCYIRGIASETLVQSIKQKIEEISIDLVADSSYIADLIAPHPHSIFQQVGTTEKPDIFTAKIAEGRVGILVDGTPIALTVPFLLLENFQAPDDYFTSPFFATIIRILRTIAVVVAILLPAFYVSSQLFKLQLLPLNLTLTIASSIQGIPLSPSLEMFLVLFVLEVIKEASIRMPKYVGMALSVVGALVLGETAVSAGFVSTPAIIIVAFSGLCLYTVPDFVETGTILRWLFLVVSGSFGPFGIVALASLLLYYLANLNSFSTPVLSPFVPLQKEDIKDSIVKLNMQNIPYRPHVFQSKNKRRMGKGEV